MIEMLNLWNDFRMVVKFIDDNSKWLSVIMQLCEKNKGSFFGAFSDMDCM